MLMAYKSLYCVYTNCVLYTMYSVINAALEYSLQLCIHLLHVCDAQQPITGWTFWRHCISVLNVVHCHSNLLSHTVHN